MADLFPTGLFAFVDKEIDIERQTLRGGVAVSGEQDIVSSDGGGRVFAEFGSGQLVDRPQIMAWRAMLATLEEGAVAVVVPFCDVRGTPFAPASGVPHSDGSPFSDGSLYVGGAPEAVTTAPAALRAVSLTWSAVLGQPVIGGEWFSIEHVGKGWRAYKIRRIDGDTIEFRPPLREAVEAGTYIELRSPRCLMRQDGPARGPTQLGRYKNAAIRFVEAP